MVKKSILLSLFFVSLQSKAIVTFSDRNFLIKKNVEYILTPKIANYLGLNIDEIRNNLNANENDIIIFKYNELDELNLDIHKEPGLILLAADHMRGE